MTLPGRKKEVELVQNPNQKLITQAAAAWVWACWKAEAAEDELGRDVRSGAAVSLAAVAASKASKASCSKNHKATPRSHKLQQASNL